MNDLGIAPESGIGSVDDLNTAVEVNEEAIELTACDHPDRVMYLNNLGNALESRFERA